MDQNTKKTSGPAFSDATPGFKKPTPKPAPLEANTSWLDEDISARAAHIADVHENGPKDHGVCSTGLVSLDTLIGGWMPGQTYVIAGKTGAGKTSFATHSAIMLALAAEQMGLPPVLFFSLEMSQEDMSDRAISWLTGISQDIVQMASHRRVLTDSQVQEISVVHKFIKRRIRLVSTTDASITAIRDAARRIHTEHGISAVVCDYIGLIEPEAGSRNGTREREVAFASRGLKAMAIELKVPVLTLSQLGRAADKEPEPRLSLLRESGSIENDASGVLFLWPSKNGAADRVRIVIAKRRFGKPWVETEVRFDGPTGRFEDIDATSDATPESQYSNDAQGDYDAQ